jgi:hypothetical protein
VTERVLKVDATLVPAPLADYSVAYPTASFEVELEGSHLVARPRPGLEFEVDAGLQRLEEELEPLLSSLAVESGWAIGLEVRHVELVDAGSDGSPILTRSFGSAGVSALIAGVTSGADRRRLLLDRIDWATRDPIYRDILDFVAEAKGAANPRPALTNLWERLEAKYGGEDAVRKQLSVSRAELRAIKGDQSRYVGDRHATYPPGTQAARIDEKARQEAVGVGRKLVSAYEQTEFGSNGLPV